MRIIRNDNNIKGRDFIVGDLHGYTDSLEILMRHVDFNYDVDRLFSVGDLVDRGPNSEKALELLRNPWFYPVMGNHDKMLMCFIEKHLAVDLRTIDYRTRLYASAFSSNGGERWLGQHLSDHEQLSEWHRLLEGIPLVRCVSDSCPFNIVHAELLAVNNPEAGKWSQDSMTESSELWSNEHYIIGYDMHGSWEDHVMWGRELRSGLVHEANIEYPDINRTYVGHTVTVAKNGKLLSAFNHVFMDTGAMHLGKDTFSDTGLCVFDHKNNIGFLHNGLDIIEVHVVDAQSMHMTP